MVCKTRANVIPVANGLTWKKGNEWNAADIKPYIEFALRHFGVDRCVCGGDWPVALLASNYEKTMGVYREVLENILTPEQKTIFATLKKPQHDVHANHTQVPTPAK